MPRAHQVHSAAAAAYPAEKIIPASAVSLSIIENMVCRINCTFPLMLQIDALSVSYVDKSQRDPCNLNLAHYSMCRENVFVIGTNIL